MSGAKEKSSEGERIGAERSFAGLMGHSVGFDDAAIEAGESAEARLADELVERLGAKGMTPRLAYEVAGIMVADWVPAGRAADDGAQIEATIKRICERVLAANNPWREADCMRMAFGFRESNDESMRSKAQLYGVTVEAISKEVEHLRGIFRLGINSFNKSEAAAEGYALTNKQRKKS